ncbi:septum site-determining protein MinC [Brytella acorum]|uniref:Probable septum site-determining protein MinC n=1 Tax=Brytella acorum TaxID=2959299 RepID=A0AA35URL9_9PROT|nr:septum site-determining protein MinC [Brytella acorum]MDF3624006.1 septum site-determining protein MinC [Brytella acorum]CAI9120891.1 septum site-determining protein MinC [Brytella acorum]
MPSSTSSSPAMPDDGASAPLRIRARGRSFLALVLSPERPLARWVEALDEQIARSAGFFAGKPVILDLALLDRSDEGLEGLQEKLVERGVQIVGIEGAARDWPALSGWTWPGSLEGGRASGAVDIPEEAVGRSGEAVSTGRSLIVTEAVRSGQSVRNLEGDLVVIGSVASGAEIVAAGSIHVYGALRGRAVAGVGGRADARIFARRMDAELLAIDGYYMTAEEMGGELTGQSAQAMLAEERIIVRSVG